MGKTAARPVARGLLALLLLAGSIVTITPFLWMLFSAVKPAAEIIRVPPSFFPETWTTLSFQAVWKALPIPRLYLNSLIVSGAVTASTLFTSAVAGYVLAKYEFPGRNLLFTLVLSTIMVPFQVIMIPLYLLMNYLHTIDTLWALILPHLVGAFGIFLLKQFAENIPNELLEAARIDGAGEWSIFWRIVRPELGPALATLGIFTFMAIWNDYLWPLVVIDSMEKRTLPIALTWFADARVQRYDLIMAASTLVVIPVVIVYFVFQRRIIEGVALTGMKS